MSELIIEHLFVGCAVWAVVTGTFVVHLWFEDDK